MKNQLFILFALFSLTIKAQDKTQRAEDSKIVNATELSIPSSPAFDLLGYNPAQVTKPSTIREVKVDWSMRTWGGKPNVALEVQPIWELLYNRADLRRYQRANKVMRMLSTLDISAGTVDEPDKDKAKVGLQRGAISAKMNLYRAKDPLRDTKLYVGIDTSYRRIQLERMELINDATFFYKRAKNDSLRAHFENLKDSLEIEYDKAATAQKEEIQKISQKYMKDNWNASHVDIAYGNVFNYEYRGNWDSVRLQGFGDAVWLNASLGIGKKLLVTGLVRYTSQNKRDTVKIEADQKLKVPIIAKSNVMTYGFNIRYGSPKFNLFTEIVCSKGNTDAAITDIRSNLNQLAFYSISYGGDWRINRNIMLSFGVRTDYRDNFRFKNLLPTASIVCMMR